MVTPLFHVCIYHYAFGRAKGLFDKFFPSFDQSHCCAKKTEKEGKNSHFLHPGDFFLLVLGGGLPPLLSAHTTPIFRWLKNRRLFCCVVWRLHFRAPRKGGGGGWRPAAQIEAKLPISISSSDATGEKLKYRDRDKRYCFESASAAAIITHSSHFGAEFDDNNSTTVFSYPFREA